MKKFLNEFIPFVVLLVMVSCSSLKKVIPIKGPSLKKPVFTVLWSKNYDPDYKTVVKDTVAEISKLASKTYKQRKVTLKTKIPITHSHSGKMPVVTSGGSSTGIPLKNHFIPVTTTATVNGGGSTVAMSTRAVEVLKADGSSSDIDLQTSGAISDILTNLHIPFTKADGSDVTTLVVA